MSQAERIRELIRQQLPDAEVCVVSDDGVHFEARVVAAAFEGLSLVKRQQLVYGALGTLIQQGIIHALSLKTYTPQQWVEQQDG